MRFICLNLRSTVESEALRRKYIRSCDSFMTEKREKPDRFPLFFYAIMEVRGKGKAPAANVRRIVEHTFLFLILGGVYEGSRQRQQKSACSLSLWQKNMLPPLRAVQKRRTCMSWARHNPNPQRKSVGDCTVRAVSAALGMSWEEAFAGLCLQGFLMCDMPSANHVWGAYLREQGFARRILPEDCPDCYTVSDFAGDHPVGTYILALPSHVVCLQDGDWLDTWDSGMEVPLYYWERSEENGV